MHVDRSETPHDIQEDEDEDNFKWDFDVVTNLLALYMAYFSSTWAISVPSSSIAFIMYEFPSDHSTTAWIAASPSLCLCVISIFLGDLSDIFGRRWFVIIGMTFGTVGMLVGGRGSSIPMIIGGQVLNGIGLTLGYLSTPLLAEVVPKRWRAPIIGGGTFLAGIAGIAGQISQGAFMKYEVGGVNKGWRIGFYIGAGFFFSSLISLLLLYHPAPRPNPEGLSTQKRLIKLDWLGILLGSSGLLLFLLGLQFGGQHDWATARVLTLLIVGGITFLAFVAWEWKGPNEGLFPASLFGHRNYAITLALNFAEGMVIFSSQAFLPQIIVALLSDDLVLTGVYNLPNAAGAMVGAVTAAAVAAKTREAKSIAITGIATLTLGGGLMAIMKPGINFAAWFFPTALIGVGIGTLGVVIPVISSICTPNRYIATSVAVGTSIRGLGGAIGIVIFSQIWTSKLLVILPAKVSRVAAAAGLPRSSIPQLIAALMNHDTKSLQQIPGVTPQILEAAEHAMAQAYSDSFRFIWYALIPFAAITLLVSLFLKTTREQMNMQVAAPVLHRHSAHLDTEAKKLEDHDSVRQ